MHFNVSAVWIAVVASAIVVFSADLSPVRASPERFVKSLSHQILVAAKTKNTARFRSLLRRHADIRGIANFALGRYRNKIPKSQRNRYYRLAENDMVNFFARYSGNLKGSAVTVGRVSKSGRLILVETRLNDGSAVSWRLSKNRRYKVRDVQVLGVWLAHLMRTTYTGVLRRDGYQQLFAVLQK